MSKAVVINVYKHKVVYKNIKNKLKKQVIFSLSIFCSLLCCLTYTKLYLNETVNDFYNQVSQVFNPITQLYSQEQNGVFVSSKNAYIASKDLNFIFPVRTGLYNVNNGEITFTVKDSIMVYAPEGGIVVECGESNFGTKYIKILHNETTFSIIDNVDIIGCDAGDIVKKGREIATAKQGDDIKLSVYTDNTRVELRVVKSNIEWN